MSTQFRCPECGGKEFRIYQVMAVRSFMTVNDDGTIDLNEDGLDDDGFVNQITCENVDCYADLSDQEIIAFCDAHSDQLTPFFRGYIGDVGPSPKAQERT